MIGNLWSLSQRFEFVGRFSFETLEHLHHLILKNKTYTRTSSWENFSTKNVSGSVAFWTKRNYFLIFDFTVRTQLRTLCVLEKWLIEYGVIIVQVQYNELVAFGSAARTRLFSGTLQPKTGRWAPPRAHGSFAAHLFRFRENSSKYHIKKIHLFIIKSSPKYKSHVKSYIYRIKFVKCFVQT